MDAAQVYWHVPLAKELQALTAFNRHKGRDNFLKKPFGLRMSQDIFQRNIDQTDNC